MRTFANSTKSCDPAASLFEGITLLHALADLAGPKLRKKDKPDDSGATSPYCRFVTLVSLLEAKLVDAAQAIDVAVTERGRYSAAEVNALDELRAHVDAGWDKAAGIMAAAERGPGIQHDERGFHIPAGTVSPFLAPGSSAAARDTLTEDERAILRDWCAGDTHSAEARAIDALRERARNGA